MDGRISNAFICSSSGCPPARSVRLRRTVLGIVAGKFGAPTSSQAKQSSRPLVQVHYYGFEAGVVVHHLVAGLDADATVFVAAEG